MQSSSTTPTNLRRALLLVGTAAFLVPLLASAETDSLYDAFRNPPATAKPFVRWWWNGNAVTEDEIRREIALMKSAGIGGFEINPIGQPEPGTVGLDWLSPEWCRLVRVAIDEAHRQGMVADLIVGSGWPFGGDFLKPGQMTKRMFVNRFPVSGPGKFHKPLAELLTPPTVGDKRGRADAPAPKLLFARLVPENQTNTDAGFSLASPALPTDELAFDIPAGPQGLLVAGVQEGFSVVELGAPGAAGPVLDHFNAGAVGSYLERMSQHLAPALGGKLGPLVRSVFCDSIELSRANWTDDFAAEFQRRRGYDLLPYLAWVMDFDKPLADKTPTDDTLRRVRYDYSRTLVEIFQERFIQTFHQWCHTNGVQSRYQAYGMPWLLGMLDSYCMTDIPEANNWLASANPDAHGFLVWTKYTSSAGHLMGRRVISTEAMTDTHRVFETTLEDIKAADDFNFIMGINHSVLHGFNYSPPSAGFPGWVRFGTYFSEQNSWWPHLPKWTAYNARLSAVMQETKPVVALAILGPEADRWAEDGLERGAFHLKPWYANQLWKAFSQAGSSADYVSETVVQSATTAAHGLQCGAMNYQALIVAGARTLQPATAEALLRHVKNGGRVLFAGEIPSRSPALKDAVQGDERIKQAVSQMLKDFPDRTSFVPMPTHATNLQAISEAMLRQLAIRRDVSFTAPQAGVYQIHQRHDQRDMFFLANTSATSSADFSARFAASGKTAWRWHPETGERTLFATPTDSPLHIRLHPLESLLLVFEPETKQPATSPPVPDAEHIRNLTDSWTLELHHAAGTTNRLENFQLADLGAAGADMNQFAGIAIYRQRFELAAGDTHAQLDLGQVRDISEVTLNGKPLGTRWYGSHLYDAAPALRAGTNELEVRVTTTLFNHARTLTNNANAKPWLVRSTRKQPMPAGLIGPVVLHISSPDKAK